MTQSLVLGLALAGLVAGTAAAQEDRRHPRRDAYGFARDARLGPVSGGEERRRAPRDRLPGSLPGTTAGTLPGTMDGRMPGTLSGSFR